MKKILSLLTIASLIASVPAPLLANTPLGRDIDKTTAELIRNKREGEETYELKLKKGKFLIKKMSNVKKIYDFSLKIESIPKKDVSDWTQKFITFYNQAGNEYVEISKRMFFNENSNVYNNLIKSNFDLKKQTKFDFNKNITLNLLKHNRSKSFMIEIVNIEIERDNKDNLDWIKQQSQFTLADPTKKMAWTRSDLITVDGALNIAMTNPNIDKVVFDNVLQPQTNKNWAINVKPEIAPRDHQLQVFFTLDGKPYTSEITVSMQAKIEATAARIKENLRALVKNTDLGNLFDNNNETIMVAINQKNANFIDDVSQLEITNKESNKITLSAKPDSTSYTGSVEVTYNVVPATFVDLKINLNPTSSEAIVVNDYVGQIDPSTITNPTQTFYYANSESTITIKKPTASSIITGVVCGCDAQWNKTSQSTAIDPTEGIVLDGSQLDTNNGKYVVELADNLNHINNLYLQIAPDKTIKNYFDTANGKQFEHWAQANGNDNIRGASARQLNNLFSASHSWTPQENGSENANSFEPQTANSKAPRKFEIIKKTTIYFVVFLIF